MRSRHLAIPLALLLVGAACGTDKKPRRANNGNRPAAAEPTEPAAKAPKSSKDDAPAKGFAGSQELSTQADIDMGRDVRKRGLRSLSLKQLDAPQVVVFAVMDTVRADHTSLCGYDRPTTPVLEAIVKERGASYACKAYSPAPWTHPSHATFFTGRSVVEHAAIWVTESDVRINPVTRVRPLDERYETVSELFDRAGYQTIAVSANMIVTRASGLLQGFDKVEVAKEALGLRGDRFLRKLKSVMKDVKKDKPVFLFLNFYDAHDPYPSIPKGVKWLPEQELVNLHPNQHETKHDYYRFVKGMMEEGESDAFLSKVTAGYDWGVHMADTNLGNVMSWLGEDGWLDKGLRLVVTSDHGEYLGEHNLLRHGGFLHEPVVNVPMLFLDTTMKKQTPLPEPFSGQAVYSLLVNGKIPVDLPPTHAVSEPNEHDVQVGALGGVIWGGTDKVGCIGGERSSWDLADDPGELSRKPSDGHPLSDDLDVLCGRIDDMYSLPPPKESSDDMMEALKAVGYMEE